MVSVNTLRSVNKAITGWKSLVRKKVDIKTIDGLGLNIPSKATDVMQISGIRNNGSKADIFILRDANGTNLGSRTLYSDGTSRVIDITKNNETYGCILGPGTPHNTIVQNRLFSNGILTSETNFFSRLFKKNGKVAMCNTTVKKTLNTDGTAVFDQEIRQILPKKGTTYVKSNSTMAQDGEMTLNTVTQQGVNLDTSNPYFITGLLNRHDMLRGTYARIAKAKGYKGIEPPLVFSDQPNKVFTGLYKDGAAGIAAEDGTYVAIRMSPEVNRTSLVNTLAHECEHEFVQHPSIHLARIRDMRSTDPISKKFYDGVERRFPKIEPNTKQYKLAETYADEIHNYDDKITKQLADGTKSIDIDAHHSLLIEKKAIEAGEKEANIFNDYLFSLEDEFSLFNIDWLWKS